MTLSVLIYEMMLGSLAAVVGVLGFDLGRSLRRRSRAGRVATRASRTVDGLARPRVARSHSSVWSPGAMRPAPSRAKRRATAHSCR
jgi:hypothetical protein